MPEEKPRTRSRSFPLIVSMVACAHIFLLMLKFVGQSQDSTNVEEALRVRLVNEARLDKKQMVQSEDPEVFRVPDAPAYQSDRNRSFDRESRARVVDKFKKSSQGNAPMELEQKDEKALKKDLKKLKFSDLGPEAGASKDPFREAAKELSAKKGTATGNDPVRSIGSTNDFIEDVPLGDMTALNTVENKYYGFYHRIRQQLEQFWGRSIQEKAEAMLAEGRHIGGDDNLITALEVTLDEKGEIVRIKVLGTSGVRELDDAAIESFNEAGPFPNPPRDLLVDGQATIEWGFVVQT